MPKSTPPGEITEDLLAGIQFATDADLRAIERPRPPTLENLRAVLVGRRAAAGTSTKSRWWDKTERLGPQSLGVLANLGRTDQIAAEARAGVQDLHLRLKTVQPHVRRVRFALHEYTQALEAGHEDLESSTGALADLRGLAQALHRGVAAVRDTVVEPRRAQDRTLATTALASHAGDLESHALDLEAAARVARGLDARIRQGEIVPSSEYATARDRYRALRAAAFEAAMKALECRWGVRHSLLFHEKLHAAHAEQALGDAAAQRRSLVIWGPRAGLDEQAVADDVAAVEASLRDQAVDRLVDMAGWQARAIASTERRLAAADGYLYTSTRDTDTRKLPEMRRTLEDIRARLAQSEAAQNDAPAAEPRAIAVGTP